MSVQDTSRQAAYTLAKTLLEGASLEMVSALAGGLARLKDPQLRQGLLAALKELEGQPDLNALWEIWRDTRQPDLEDLLLAKGLPASQPLALKVLSSLKLGQVDWMADADGRIVAPLLQASADPEPQAAARARQALENLDASAAQEEVCRWVIEYDHPAARQAALEAGYTPRWPERRALFYLLTGQWERYQALDFDASLLRAVHQAADVELRAAIAEQARQAGWSGYVEAIASSRGARPLSDLQDVEWQVILSILGRHRRWEEIWRLAQSAPPLWSARLLQELRSADWSPSESEERQAFENLTEMAMNCLAQGAPPEKLPQEVLPLRGHTRLVTALAFSSDGAWLASASADKNVLLWASVDGHLHAQLSGHTAFVVSLAFSPNGEMLASGAADRSLRLWSSPAGDPLHVLGRQTGEVAALAFGPSGQLLASGDSASVQIWEPANGRLLAALPVEDAPANSLAFSPDGHFLACGCAANALRLWRAPGGEPVKTLMEQVACWSFSPVLANETALLATASSYGRVRLWDIPGGELAKTLEGHADGQLLVFSPGGDWLAASDQCLIRLWSFPDGHPWVTLEGHDKPLNALVFSPDGRMLASAGKDCTLRLWGLPSGRLVRTLEGFEKPIRHLAFSPDGARLACADQERLQLWPLYDLGVLFRCPPGLLNTGQANQLQELLASDEIAPAERAWLNFAQELHRWQGRFDIEIEDAPRRIIVGEFDIEISA